MGGSGGGLPEAIRIEVLRLDAGLELPSYATPGAAGMDLRSSEAVELAPLGRALVPTGLKLAIPPGFEGQVRPRSGLAVRFGVTVLNAPGTIDSDYRGEIKVLLVNLGGESVRLERGERIAQIVFASVQVANLELVATLGETARGDGGFGHTGRT